MYLLFIMYCYLGYNEKKLTDLVSDTDKKMKIWLQIFL